MKSKKNYVYFAAPLLALIIFVPIYLQFRGSYDQEQADLATAAQKVKDDQVRVQNHDREEAIKKAVADSERRKKEREAAEAATQKRNDDRQAAYQARDQALTDQVKSQERAEKLDKEVAIVKEDIAKIEADEKVLKGQKVFLDSFLPSLTANSKHLDDVLESIKTADAAAEAAALVAAKAKKS